jgi:hypothetical protein
MPRINNTKATPSIAMKYEGLLFFIDPFPWVVIIASYILLDLRSSGSKITILRGLRTFAHR